MLALLLLLSCALGALADHCGPCGMLRCSGGGDDERACVAFGARLHPALLPPLRGGLTRARAAPLPAGSLTLPACAAVSGVLGDPWPHPLLRNTFGPSPLYGDLVLVPDPAPEPACPVPRNCSSAVTVLINRDMDGNLFHALYNTAFPLFRASVQLGFDVSAASALLVDLNTLSSVDRQLLTALLNCSDAPHRLQHWSERPLPQQHAQCFEALVLGVGRHWRSWLGPAGSTSHNEHLRPFADWVRAAFGLGPLSRSASGLVTVVDRKVWGMRCSALA